MDDSKKDDVVISAEEKQAEVEASKEVKSEEVRASVIAEYGFNEVDDAERIDKLVAKEVDNRKKLSQAIGQKIKHRNEAQELRSKVVVPPIQKESKVVDSEEVGKVVDGKLTEVLEKRDLESMEYPDNIKKEIARVAKMTGVSIKQAEKDPYIVFQYIEPYQKEQRNNEASVSRTNRGGGKQVSDFDSPPDVDMNTEAGRATWDSWKKDQIKKGH